MTWAPFRFIWPRTIELMWRFPPFDVLVNIALFIPVGFLISASSPSRALLKPFAWAKTVLFGVIFSAIIEVGQIFLIERYTSVWDVLWNGLGTAIGALGYAWISRGLSRLLPSHTAFELPIMVLVYLATIALWLNGFASVEDPRRPVLGILPAIVGVIVIAAVWRYRFAAVFTRHQAMIGVLVWFAVTAVPSLVTSPLFVATSAVVVVMLMWYLTGLRDQLGDDERRFELPTLRRAALSIVVYILLLALWPLPLHFGQLNVEFHLSGLSPDPTIPQILGVLEHHVAFTILGFMIAEGRSRRRESLGQTLLWVFGVSLVSSLGFQALRGLHTGMHASLVEGFTTILAAIAGGALYRTQLAAVQSWIASGEVAQQEGSVDDLLDRFDEK